MKPKTFSQEWDHEEDFNSRLNQVPVPNSSKKDWKFYIKWILIILVALTIVNLLMRYL